jgi:hypothetical protein
MRSNTQTVTIATAGDAVFAFVADPENLPRWAIGFARGIRRDGDQWLVATGQGEVPIRFGVDQAAGVIDFHLEPAPGVAAAAYSRVLPAGDGADYVFTQFQSPGMSDEVFDAQVAALGHELVTLKALLEVACPL